MIARLNGLMRAKGLLAQPITRPCEFCHESFSTCKPQRRFCSTLCQRRQSNLAQKAATRSEYTRYLEVMTPCPWGCVNAQGLPLWGPKARLYAHREHDHPELRS